jgi:hypothetical protein
MASHDKSFADLVAEAPAAPAEGTVSLVGSLAKSSEAGKFVLTLQDGQSVTLETSAVKGHTVLGSSLGHTIVQIEVDAGKVPAINPQPLPPLAAPQVRSAPWGEYTLGHLDLASTAFFDPTGPYAPFVLATPQQAPANVLGALNPGFVSQVAKLPLGEHSTPALDATGLPKEGYTDPPWRGPWGVGGWYG